LKGIQFRDLAIYRLVKMLPLVPPILAILGIEIL
jgi:hypothetical protein